MNSTEEDIEQYMDNHQWSTVEVIAYAASIAGLFHDFGKATVLFQAKIDPGQKGTEKFTVVGKIKSNRPG